MGDDNEAVHGAISGIHYLPMVSNEWPRTSPIDGTLCPHPPYSAALAREMPADAPTPACPAAGPADDDRLCLAAGQRAWSLRSPRSQSGRRDRLLPGVHSGRAEGPGVRQCSGHPVPAWLGRARQ
ncbi:hypothetical protein G6F40_015107 [Rhizopus arrhizus]|nr:hypothetical protein G6F40_015107 [Rhizopus arrhizus]